MLIPSSGSPSDWQHSWSSRGSPQEYKQLFHMKAKAGTKISLLFLAAAFVLFFLTADYILWGNCQTPWHSVVLPFRSTVKPQTGGGAIEQRCHRLIFLVFLQPPSKNWQVFAKNIKMENTITGSLIIFENQCSICRAFFFFYYYYQLLSWPNIAQQGASACFLFCAMPAICCRDRGQQRMTRISTCVFDSSPRETFLTCHYVNNARLMSLSVDLFPSQQVVTVW